MISEFSIRRPRFAFVVSILITLSGLLAIPSLPVAEFPDIAPPTISVSTSYPGADASVVRDSIAALIEPQVNGVEGMQYLSSVSGNDGSYNLTVTFETGVDTNIAMVEVQNRVNRAMAQLPEEVKREGVDVRKQSTTMLMTINLYSEENQFDDLFLANYAQIFLKDELARINGVSDVEIMGSMNYAMRIWLDPNRMAALNVTAQDVMSVIRSQNVQAAAGQIGAPPALPDQQFQYNVIASGRLVEAEEFKNIAVRARPEGGMVLLGDIARIELGSEFYGAFGQLDNRPSAVIAIYQLPDANALDVAEKIREKMAALQERFPEGLVQSALYDTTVFVSASIREVVETLVTAVILVIIVVFLFLQDWRSTLIPAIAIPVSLIGTFAVMLGLGMSINTITLFALILAIGIVVDDAIIVVENTQRLMGEGLPPKEAALKTMEEVASPVIATTLVLLAVFVPTMLMPGLTGKMYQQFAITISIAVIISSLNALTLSPALCSTLLKPGKGDVTQKETGMFGWFNKAVHRTTAFYSDRVAFIVKHPMISVATIVALALLCTWLFRAVPSGFVPDEDKGFFMLHAQLADGASLQRTLDVTEQVTNILNQQPGVKEVIAVPGYNMLGGGVNSNTAFLIAVLDSWEERDTPELHQMAIMDRAQEELMQISNAQLMLFPVPSLPGGSSVGGFEFVLEDLMGRAPQDLAEVMTGVINAANQRPEIARAFTSFQASTPQLRLNVDKNKAHTLGIDLADVYLTLQAFLGGMYVNDFNKFGKVFRVMVQADKEFRNSEVDLAGFYVRGKGENLVPVIAVTDVEPMVAPQSINRYNLYNSVTLNGSPAPGKTSGQAMAAMIELGEQLPEGFAFEWTGTSKQELSAGNLAPILFSLAIVFVYLFLVAQYESWSIPLAVLLSVPIAIGGALLAVWLVGGENNLYTQIGLVLLIGMASKSAILITEFASLQRDAGKSIADSAIKATRLRFRAVLMTALSFVLGVMPLLVASGAGAESRKSLGLAIFGGMVAASLFSTLLVPVYYALLQGIREKVKGGHVVVDRG
ncbi:efflux RND transporter permease subunit [Biformimicrobium ophioploci]|uniref:Efflux pump membrane transporter n=1 Tax=Biformimicrobium ophioploci TaxID=3036711 RepID=A0ABQ6LXW3_9GAMM|nr:multidrug efflux RND transporter permease subunit [Microbulbifer sp. NKW57]GMG86862.1 efflux RND transporter permease subunit VmeQ [Microbulbifer sp. NKW57]